MGNKCRLEKLSYYNVKIIIRQININCKNEENCKKIYKHNLTTFTNAEKNHLKKLILNANKLLKPYPALYDIGWVFCKIKPNI